MLPPNDVLLEFLRTGALGQIRFGMTPEQIQDLLGHPDDVGLVSRPHTLWKYGDVELHFRDHSLWMIHLEPAAGRVRLPSRLGALHALPLPEWSELQTELHQRGIPLRNQPTLTGPEQEGFLVGSCASITVNCSNGALESISARSG